MKAFLFSLFALLLAGCGGGDPGRENALRLRNELAFSGAEARLVTPRAKERYRLPVSRPFSQGNTQLCWMYATLNVLETDYLGRHPGETLELSRSAMQYFTWEDRYRRKIETGDDYLWERGTEVDAIPLIRRRGLVAFEDFHPDPVVLPQPGPFALAGTTPGAQLQSLYEALAQAMGTPPDETHYRGAEVTRAKLAGEVLGNEEWEAYAPSSDGREGYARHWDEDAHRETLAWYLPVPKFWAVIHDALRRGHALALSICGHDILLYGADYDAKGAPLAFYVKDNYADPFYAISPAKIKLGRNFCGVSTIKQ